MPTLQNMAYTFSKTGRQRTRPILQWLSEKENVDFIKPDV